MSKNGDIPLPNLNNAVAGCIEGGDNVSTSNNVEAVLLPGPPADVPPAVPLAVDPLLNPPTADPHGVTQDIITRCGFPRFLRTRLCKRLLIGTVAVGIIISLILLVALLKRENDSPLSVHQEMSKFYTENLNFNVDPCTDFYGFVCGKSTARFKAQKHTKIDTKGWMQQKVWESLAKILSTPANSSDRPYISELKVFYNACTNYQSSLYTEVEEILRLIDDIGGWPVLNEKSEEESSQITGNDNSMWHDVVGRINRQGIATYFPFNLYLKPDPVNRTQVSILLMPYLYKRALLPTTNNRTIDYVQSVASLLLGTESNKTVGEAFNRSMVFEAELYNLTKFDEFSYKYSSVANLRYQFPGFNWKVFFKRVFLENGVTIEETEYVTIAYPKYPSRVAKLLKKTPVSTVQNYLTFRILDDVFSMLPIDSIFRVLQRRFYQQTFTQPRSLDCVQVLIGTARVPMGQLYIDNFFTREIKIEVEELYKNLTLETAIFLDQVNWLNDDAKTKVVANLVALKAIVGYDEKDASMERFFGHLKFDQQSNLFNHYRKLLKFQQTFSSNRLSISTLEDTRMISFDYGSKVDQLFYPDMKIIFVLASMLQPPVFHTNMTNYFKYGGLGFIISHEITHGLGILAACPNKTVCPGTFEDVKKCLTDAYNNYTFNQSELKINGTRTLEENLGDLIGLKVAYRAFEKWSEENNASEPLIDGMELSANQLFFTNAANFHCNYRNDESLKYFLEHDEHSPEEARVNLVMKNFEEFGRAFNCTTNASTSSDEVCRV